MEVTPVTSQVCVVNFGSNNVTVIDGAANVVANTVNVGRSPESQKDSYTPKYELLALEDGGQVHFHTVNSITVHLSDGTEVINPHRNERFFDVSGMPLNEGQITIDYSAKPVTLASLAIEGNSAEHYLKYYTIDKELKSAGVSYQPRLEGTSDIRSLYLPAAILPGDPDADALTDANAAPEIEAIKTASLSYYFQNFRNRCSEAAEIWRRR
jgi:YVTN family beta-propeller protein